ncbi:hypothetical protein RhiirA5_441305 [Rhizophagus irregularis]|uniref:Uncharacterized protein n=1 Tax=Rhizophagus irregularis TaxID=588596 RepID=A0A2N0NFV3_9GLOM|nr:hypothetical protein RhiirA5_441305 [Rhizophagus irregularis]
MTKSKKNCINKDRTKVTNSAPKTRKFVECNCLLHCGGGTRNELYSVKLSSDEKGKKRIRVVENTSDDDDGDNDDDGDDGDESPDERGKKRIRAVEYLLDDDDESLLSDNEPMPERPER